jgi:imidazolonepropionase
MSSLEEVNGSMTIIDADLVVRNAGQVLTMIQTVTGPHAGPAALVGPIPDGAVAIEGDTVVWVGRESDLELCVRIDEGTRVLDARGGVVLPGLVDPHTHIVFAGSRHAEFALRIAGAGYLEILAAGGGILSTVRATRAASHDELVQGGLERLARLLSFGVTTCEVKSGYGLTTESEIEMLEVARTLAGIQPVRIVPTFLGAHVFPEEYTDDHDGYVDLICREMIPQIASRGLAVMCDVFLDKGVFDLDQARRILTAGAEVGLTPRMHAGQFADLGGPGLAAELGAACADHLEHVSDAGVRAMAEAGVVACLLPGAALSLGLKFPQARRLREAGVEVALATDCNPGTSRTENLPLMATLAATAMGLTIEDALRGITCVAARALGLEHEVGSIGPGFTADLAVFDVPDYRSLAYHFGVNHCRIVVAGGDVVVG